MQTDDKIIKQIKALEEENARRTETAKQINEQINTMQGNLNALKEEFDITRGKIEALSSLITKTKETNG